MVSTNMGLFQSNMMWLVKNRGLSYYWILDLFSRLKLPIFDGVAESLKKANEVHEKNLIKSKLIQSKKKGQTGRRQELKNIKKGNSGCEGKLCITHMTVMMLRMKRKELMMRREPMDMVVVLLQISEWEQNIPLRLNVNVGLQNITVPHITCVL